MENKSENLNKTNEIKYKVVETYADDMVKVLENDKSGLIKKIIHDKEESEEKKRLSPASIKNKIFMFVSLVLILIAGAVLFFFFSQRTNLSIPVEQQLTPLIFNDQSAFIEVVELTKEQIAQSVSNTVQKTKVKRGGVEGIYLTYNKKLIGLREFLSIIKSSFAPGDNRLFISDSFLMGVVNGATDASLSSDKNFFILLKVRSLTDIFDSIRAWENKMFFDLHGFFGLDISSATNPLLTRGFEDSIVENKNARILYDDTRNIVIMYVLANDNSVIITNSEIATYEIIRRLAASQIKK